jgi:hypothetical protein
VHKNAKVTCLDDYRSGTLTYVAMKCFKRLVKAHINTIIPDTPDHQPRPTPIRKPPQQIHRSNTPRQLWRGHDNTFPLARLKRFDKGPQVFKKLHSCTIESILIGCITGWYGNWGATECSGYGPVHHWGQASCHPGPTVEVVSLHTLRLESLKLVFQPLHKFLVNKLWFWQVG